MKEIKHKQKNNNQQTDQKANIGYTGTVNVTITDSKNKVISKQTHHNKGSINLFEFLALCLAGKYTEAKDLRPNKILLVGSTSSVSNPDTLKNEFNGDASTTYLKTLSGLIAAYGDNKTDVENIDGTPLRLSSYKTTLHFRVPYAYIEEGTIYGVALYPVSTERIDGNTEIRTHWSAYYLFEKDNALVPLHISTSQNYNLIIDWELSIGNQAASA